MVHRAALGVGVGVRKPRAIFPCCCSLGYLERWELLWDWLEDVVAPLSWEKPLLQDSRLDMDPLRWDKTHIFVRKADINGSDRSAYFL